MQKFNKYLCNFDNIFSLIPINLNASQYLFKFSNTYFNQNVIFRFLYDVLLSLTYNVTGTNISQNLRNELYATITYLFNLSEENAKDLYNEFHVQFFDKIENRKSNKKELKKKKESITSIQELYNSEDFKTIINRLHSVFINIQYVSHPV